MKFKPHSVVSVITNSSTTIYTHLTSNAVQITRDIINQVLKDGGSDKTCDDLYTVVAKADIDDDQWLMHDLAEERVYDDYDEEEYSSEEWDELIEAEIKLIREELADGTFDYSFLEGRYDEYIEIIPKNGDEQAKRVMNKIMEIYEQEEVYS